MARAPFNVLVLPYRRHAAAYEYAVFYRADPEMWQFIAGGGEDGEDPAGAARREALEEGGIGSRRDWMALDARASIPRTSFPGAPWPDDVLVIPEFCFAVDVGDAEIRISKEHERFAWLGYEATRERLTWDSNRVALWELHERLSGRSNKAM